MNKAINCKKLVAFVLSSYSRLNPIFHKKARRSLINCELTVAAELICQKIDGLICHGQPN